MFLGRKFDRPVQFLLSSSQHFTSCQTVLRLVYCRLVRHPCWLSIGVSLSCHHVRAKCSRLLQISRLGKSKRKNKQKDLQSKIDHAHHDLFIFPSKVFSILFIVLVIYLDMLCWALLVGPWLFLIASACVWLEMNSQTTGTICLAIQVSYYGCFSCMWRYRRECRPSRPPLLASQDHLQHIGNVVRLFPNKYFLFFCIYTLFIVSSSFSFTFQYRLSRHNHELPDQTSLTSCPSAETAEEGS